MKTIFKPVTTWLTIVIPLTLLGTSALAFPGAAQPAGKSQGAMPPGHPAMSSGQAMPASTAPQATPVTGTVVETFESGGYSYVALDQGGQRTWVASPPVKVAVGQKVSFNPGMVMRNFTSKSLNRTFDSIVFSNGLATAPAAAKPAAAN